MMNRIVCALVLGIALTGSGQAAPPGSSPASALPDELLQQEYTTLSMNGTATEDQYQQRVLALGEYLWAHRDEYERDPAGVLRSALADAGVLQAGTAAAVMGKGQGSGGGPNLCVRQHQSALTGCSHVSCNPGGPCPDMQNCMRQAAIGFARCIRSDCAVTLFGYQMLGRCTSPAIPGCKNANIVERTFEIPVSNTDLTPYAYRFGILAAVSSQTQQKAQFKLYMGKNLLWDSGIVGSGPVMMKSFVIPHTGSNMGPFTTKITLQVDVDPPPSIGQFNSQWIFQIGCQ